GVELEARFPLVEDVGADHVRGQEVHGALNARVLGVERAGEGPRERGLADPGIVLDQHVAPGEQRDKEASHDLVPDLHGLLDVVPQPGAGLRYRDWIELRQRGHSTMVRSRARLGFKAEWLSLVDPPLRR